MLLGCVDEDAPPEMPAGFVRMWGARGRIDATFVKPRVIDILRSGEVIVIDRSGRVQRFAEDGSFKDKFVLANTEKGCPTGMTVGPEGNLWIAETHAYRVGVYDTDFNEVFAFGEYGGGDGRFAYVTDVAVAPTGQVYVSEYGGVCRVQEFDMEGRFARCVGSEGREPGEFVRPQALLCVEDGSLFVADAVNHRIQKFASDGSNTGVFGTPGDGEGELLYPYDLALGDDGTIYIAEYGNHRVQRMSQDGRFMGTWAGGGRLRLADPWGVAVKGDRMLVLDTGNSRVIELDLRAVKWSMGPGA
jgi:DNA-binding beta-propeller fold protein YncE